MADLFDKDKLRSLAWDRFQRQVRGVSRRQVARGPEGQWYRDMLYIEKLAAVVAWAESKGMSVALAKRVSAAYDPNSKLITISGSASPERMLHYLLHECGHHLIGMEEAHERFGKGYPRIGSRGVVNSMAHRIACLEEEFEAWHRGWKLAKRLELEVDRQEFDRTRTECLKSYIAWAGGKGKL